MFTYPEKTRVCAASFVFCFGCFGEIDLNFGVDATCPVNVAVSWRTTVSESPLSAPLHFDVKRCG